MNRATDLFHSQHVYLCEAEEREGTGVTMTTICFINVTDSSLKNSVKLNTASELTLNTRPGVVSQGEGGCDMQLKTLAIFLSPVCGEIRNSSCLSQ